VLQSDVAKSPARFSPGAIRCHAVCFEFRGFFRKVEFHFLAQRSARLVFAIQYLSRRNMSITLLPSHAAIAKVSLAYFRASAANCLRPTPVIL